MIRKHGFLKAGKHGFTGNTVSSKSTIRPIPTYDVYLILSVTGKQQLGKELVQTHVHVSLSFSFKYAEMHEASFKMTSKRALHPTL